jgi:hypothetical protein
MNKEIGTDTRNDVNHGSRTHVAHIDGEAGIPVCRRSKRSNKLSLSNSRLARTTWGLLPAIARKNLERLSDSLGLSIAAGDLQFLDGKWYVTHSGLLRIAQRRRCAGIRTTLLKDFSDCVQGHWVFKATVYKTSGSRGFVGYGDADPSNTSPLVRGAEMRVAETRAVNRALRKAYGIGSCSVEELGYLTTPPQPTTLNRTASPKSNGDGSGNGQPRLRDRLCLLIRQHQLDPTLVKRYAADFCGTQEIREASRDLVESFITHLAEWAARDRSGLLCKLNSFAPSQSE